MRKILFFLLSTFICMNMMAQINYKIKVIDEKTGEIIPSASIIIKGTKQGVMTNVDGIAEINTDKKNSIEISAVGYKMSTVRLFEKNDFTVKLEINNEMIYDVVLVGTRGAARAKPKQPSLSM